MDIAQFRADFPEFSDTARYTDSQITFWATLATAQVNPNAWKLQTNLGIELYVAHEITLAAQNIAVVTNGGAPGGASTGVASGPVQSKAVGAASVSYNTEVASEKNAGWWNLTIYGKQFYRLSQIFGAGGFQVAQGSCGYGGGGWYR